MNELKVLIEIPEGSSVKYEVDESTWELTVDRLMPTAMSYPVSYGLIYGTHGGDGDALDALVFISQPVAPGVIIMCKVLGLLEMEDEAGVDHKIVCVPASTKIDPICGAWEKMSDIPEAKKASIKHFFEHYKDLEKDKFVKLKDWNGQVEAKKVLDEGIKKYEEMCAQEEEDHECLCGRHK